MRLAAASLLLLPLVLVVRATAGEEWMYDPRFREPGPTEVIAAGPPELTRGDLDAFVDLLDASFDLAVPAVAERALRDAVEDGWADAPADARTAFLRLVAPCADLRARAAHGEANELDAGLRDFRRGLDGWLASRAGTPAARAVDEVLSTRRTTLWPGDPPVVASHASAWLEMCAFLASLGRNDRYEPSVGQREAVEQVLAEALHGKGPEVRNRLVQVHRTWLRTKAAWDRADAAKRLALRAKALDLVARTLPEEERIPVGEPEDFEAYARVAGMLARLQSGFEAWTNLGRYPEVVLPIVEAWLGPLPEGGDQILLFR